MEMMYISKISGQADLKLERLYQTMLHQKCLNKYMEEFPKEMTVGIVLMYNNLSNTTGNNNQHIFIILLSSKLHKNNYLKLRV